MTKRNLGLTIEDLIEKLSFYMKKEELELVKKSYDYACNMHYGVKRLTGEDYIEHSLNVAYILTEVHADVETICAGLLHDVLEDCDVSKEELSKLFSFKIADLVDGVTKINKINLFM